MTFRFQLRVIPTRMSLRRSCDDRAVNDPSRTRLCGVVILVGLLLIATACSGDEKSEDASPYGKFAKSQEQYARSLDDVQADWWPKDDQGLYDTDKSNVAFNQTQQNTKVLGGDERNFLTVAEEDGDGWKPYSHVVTVRPGKRYRGVVFFHNGSVDTESTDTRVSLSLPDHVLRRTPLTARIASGNSFPSEVGSQAVLATEIGQPAVFLTIESARVSIKGADNTYELNDPQRLTSSHGADIGCTSPNGNIPSGDDCWGAVIFTFRASSLSFLTNLFLAHDHDVSYENSIIYTPGEELISIGLKIINTGDKRLEGVTLSIPDFSNESAVKLDLTTALWRRDDQGWSTLDGKSAAVSVGGIDPQHSAMLSVRARILQDISGLLCSKGSVTIEGIVETQSFQTSKSTASIFPDPSTCSSNP